MQYITFALFESNLLRHPELVEGTIAYQSRTKVNFKFE
jgi:hypothetical protein